MENDDKSKRLTFAEALKWGYERHRYVAKLAEGQLQSDNAKKEIAQILQTLNQESLPDVATWADEVKKWRKPKPTDHPETKKFFEDKRNVLNWQWHFVNLPLGVDVYDRQKYPAFTREDDIVQIINLCVLKLQGKTDRFSIPNALRLLVHFVGDIHQPVHVGCCYINKSGGGQIPTLVSDPQQAVGLESDRGGNRLILQLESGTASLHHFWDSGFSQDSKTEEDPDVLARQEALWLSKSESKSSLAKGDPATWAVQWATESLAPAREAYKGISIKEPYKEDDYLVAWEGVASYIKRNQKTLDDQLSKAGSNLATLLDALWP